MSDSLIISCPHCRAANRVPAARLTEQPTCGKCKQPLFTGQPQELDDAGFAALIGRSDLPVVVDCWAPWCAPCRQMAPAFAQTALGLEPRYQFAKIDTEAHPALASRLNIRSIPTVIVFRQGRELARQSGAMDVHNLTRWIQSIA